MTASSLGRATECEGDMGGVIRPASPPGESSRRFLDALLFLPRSGIRIAVITSSATASFIEDQNLVPRTRALLGSEDGKLHIVPTINVASGLRPDLGARLTAQAGAFGSMLRTSIVGRDSFLTESRLLLGFGREGHSQLMVEWYQQRNGDLAFAGVGPDPLRDPRNAYLPGREGVAAMFLEKRQRFIVNLAHRVSNDLEVLLSSSLQRREIDDPRAAGTGTIAQTFAPGSVAGAYGTSDRVYTEAAARLDTRAVRGPPVAGLLLEGYLGASSDIHGTYSSAMHAGARAAWFVSVVRKTNILSPRLSFDVVDPSDRGALPFREYAYASGFHGPDGRVDLAAVLASIDYRWQLVPYVAARLFVDATTVAPSITALRVDHLAWAVGAGVDFHSSTTQIGRIGLAYSAKSIQLVFVYGLSDQGFGDRQHR
ncbi:MAG: hypothetical protein ACXWUG_08190 [Polyangiales bacterium]